MPKAVAYSHELNKKKSQIILLKWFVNMYYLMPMESFIDEETYESIISFINII